MDFLRLLFFLGYLQARVLKPALDTFPMNIILVELNTDPPKPEMSFSKAAVRVGRDASDCDVVFERARYPMVSRHHAEFRCVAGVWTIADLNSTYGLFLNGRKVSEPEPVAAGNKIQFGEDGPTVVIIWCEASAAEGLPQQPVRPAPVPGGSFPPKTPSSSEYRRPASGSWEMSPAGGGRQVPKTVNLIFENGLQRAPISIGQGETWLGRDPGCDVVIDSEAQMVSRKHAVIRAVGEAFVIEDNKSFNGTLVNERRLSEPHTLHHGDRIRLGMGGPVVKFSVPGEPVSSGAVSLGSVSVKPLSVEKPGVQQPVPGPSTMMIDGAGAGRLIPAAEAAQPLLLTTVGFGDKSQLTIGRGADNDIRLDGLQISNHHARLVRSADGSVVIEDLRSTNGVYVNGRRSARETIGPHDRVQIGAFLIMADPHAANLFDTRSRTRLDLVNVSRRVGAGGSEVTLLDSISLSIRPNEFVGVLGASGAGKSMLMHVMTGLDHPADGRVLVNGLDLHRHLDSLKHSIGFVPQEDIIHRGLTVYRSLYYVAKMRLSRDVSAGEIAQIVDEVLDITGLAERRSVKVSELSGGQRKRVSIAVELVTKPSVIFLDEPTSGLDPAAEERTMKLFRRIAESGRTVVMSTHAMENVQLFDKVVVLARGKLAFYGTPAEALQHFEVASFKELYSRLEGPAENEADRDGSSDRSADAWRTKYRTTAYYREYIEKPQGELGSLAGSGSGKKRRLGVAGTIAQWFALTRRYFEVLLNDKWTLFILLAQAPVIALMTFFIAEANQPRDFVYFVLAIVAVWFGTSVSAREIVRERAIYQRERMVNLGLVPYLGSKLFVIGVIVALQCFLLFVPLKLFDLAGLMKMPGELLGVPQLWAMLLTAGVGVAGGLLISALVRTSEMATGLVPLVLIPQMLFSGLAGVPEGSVNRLLTVTMPAAWSFDTIKRFSTLDTLEPEGANPKGRTRGMGLYKFIESENEKTVAAVKQDLEDYKNSMESRYQEQPGGPPPPPDLTAATIRKIPDDLSPYVTFLHPWMNEVLNQFVLVLMFGMLAAATLLVLRLRDN
jgi:ABC transport system ATP-binding/permease protein